AKPAHTVRDRVRRCGVEEPDHRHRALLRARRERPCCYCATKQCNELAAFHSITSSARASSVGGTERPRSFAVCRLMTSSNLVDWITGRSEGFAPFKMRPVYTPT